MKIKEQKKDDAPVREVLDVGISAGSTEIVSRFGSANAEWLKAYRGVDKETGQILSKGLKGIANGKLHPDYSEANIHQQAGYAAEVAKVADDNAQRIIEKSDIRTIRTDDDAGRKLANNNRPDMISDHIEIQDGKEVVGSASQMKIIYSREGNERLLKKVAEGEGGGKNDLSRYLQNDHLELAGEHCEGAKDFCKKQASSLRQQAEYARNKGSEDLAHRLEQKAQNYEELHDKISPTFTSEEARNFRLNPKIETTKKIAKISHNAGVDAAKVGAVIGGTVSLATNILAVMQDDKELKAALIDIATDTGKAAAVGYGTGFAGSGIKATMQQADSALIRQISKTSLPALVVSTSLALGASINRYVHGEINGVQFMEEIGEKGSGMLASSMMATAGQMVIPIPVVGAIIGGMVGYTVSSLFYRSSLQAFQQAREAETQYLWVKAQCEEARSQMLIYQKQLQDAFDAHMADARAQLSDYFTKMDGAAAKAEMDDFAVAANQLGAMLGSRLQFDSQKEFNVFMQSEKKLIL